MDVLKNLEYKGDNNTKIHETVPCLVETVLSFVLCFRSSDALAQSQKTISAYKLTNSLHVFIY